MRISALSRLAAGACCAAALAFGASTMQTGKAGLKSAGALAIGPDGILFGDSAGGAIFALDVNDKATAKAAGTVEIAAINEKIAALLGTTADQIALNDVVVNPARRTSTSPWRGKGADAVPVILVDPAGKITEVSLDNIKHASVALPRRPTADRRPVETITSMKYVKGQVLIAGLSNEEFASSLRSIPYPFQEYSKPAGIEIYGARPLRGQRARPHLRAVRDRQAAEHLAAYTCAAGEDPDVGSEGRRQGKGTTIAELGNGCNPLDMIVYNKGDKHFILMANSSRGVMKLPADNLETFKGITERIPEKAGVPYETSRSLQGVQQLDKLDDSTALVLINSNGSMNSAASPSRDPLVRC